MSTMNRREAIGTTLAAGATTLAAAALPREGLEQRAYREFLDAIGGPGGVRNENEQSAARFARDSMQPGGLLRTARLRAGLTPFECADRAEIGQSGFRIMELEEGSGDEMSFSEGMKLCPMFGIQIADLAEEVLSRRG
jgi:hypothetical protein